MSFLPFLTCLSTVSFLFAILVMQSYFNFHFLLYSSFCSNSMLILLLFTNKKLQETRKIMYEAHRIYVWFCMLSNIFEVWSTIKWRWCRCTISGFFRTCSARLNPIPDLDCTGLFIIFLNMKFNSVCRNACITIYEKRKSIILLQIFLNIKKIWSNIFKVL